MKCLSAMEYELLGFVERLGAGETWTVQVLQAAPQDVLHALRTVRGLWRFTDRLLPGCHCGHCIAPEVTPLGQIARRCFELLHRGIAA